VLLGPRPSHSKKDPNAAKAFRETLADRLEKLAVLAGSKVKIWMMDEARFGLHTEMRRRWACKGQRPVVTRQIKYELDYLYGSLDVIGEQAHFLPSGEGPCKCHRDGPQDSHSRIAWHARISPATPPSTATTDDTPLNDSSWREAEFEIPLTDPSLILLAEPFDGDNENPAICDPLDADGGFGSVKHPSMDGASILRGEHAPVFCIGRIACYQKRDTRDANRGHSVE
jgi:hypothetical protein